MMRNAQERVALEAELQRQRTTARTTEDRRRAVNLGTIRCPNCHSSATTRVTGKAKLGKVLLIGIFAIPNMGKSYRCFDCKFRW